MNTKSLKTKKSTKKKPVMKISMESKLELIEAEIHRIHEILRLYRMEALRVEGEFAGKITNVIRLIEERRSELNIDIQTVKRSINETVDIKTFKQAMLVQFNTDVERAVLMAKSAFADELVRRLEEITIKINSKQLI